MAKRIGYCLTARSPFHFGERGVGMEEASVLLHSDTLFSALCLIWQQLGGNLDAFLNNFPRQRFEENKPVQILSGEPPLRISSAFPFWSRQENKRLVESVFFFPKPYLRLRLHSRTDSLSQAKALKRVQFVSQRIFEMLLAGQEVTFEASIQGGKIWLTPQEKQKIEGEKIWVEETRPHVTVDRISSASQVYAVGQVRFQQGSGLFFLVDYEDERWQPVLEKALRALGDSGIGGERSSGCGQFDLEIVENFTLHIPETADAFTSLSLYWPPEEEAKSGVLDGASYGLLMRRGWIGTPGGMNLRRRGVRMFSEGSVFPKQPMGALVDVKPLDPEEVPNVGHDVWRCGLGFSLPCRRVQEVNDG
ncbi:MAG: type III-A CRISPR-associated RAMP protein Csm4 [Anaerolineae bacterium]